jgi:hypothetical protein
MTEKRIKMSSFSLLRYKRCLIKLDEHEERFLSSKLEFMISEGKVNLNAIKSAIEDFYYKSPVRYFSLDEVNEISVDMMNRVKKQITLNEELGRNIQSLDPDPISNEDVYIDKEEENSISYNTNTNTGEREVFINNKTKKTFKTDDEQNLFIKNLR